MWQNQSGNAGNITWYANEQIAHPNVMANTDPRFANNVEEPKYDEAGNIINRPFVFGPGEHPETVCFRKTPQSVLKETTNDQNNVNEVENTSSPNESHWYDGVVKTIKDIGKSITNVFMDYIYDPIVNNAKKLWGKVTDLFKRQTNTSIYNDSEIKRMATKDFSKNTESAIRGGIEEFQELTHEEVNNINNNARCGSRSSFVSKNDISDFGNDVRRDVRNRMALDFSSNAVDRFLNDRSPNTIDQAVVIGAGSIYIYQILNKGEGSLQLGPIRIGKDNEKGKYIEVKKEYNF